MSLILTNILDSFEKEVPLSLQESWDRSGLQVGSRKQRVKKVLFSLDATHEVLDEAIQKKIDLIVTHHPLQLSDFKAIDLDTYEGCMIKRAIQKNIAIYSAHTNHDASWHSLSFHYAKKLKLKNVNPIHPIGPQSYCKLVVYTPAHYTDKIRDAIFEAGGGEAGSYSRVSFCTSGKGTFKGEQTAHPFLGRRGVLSKVSEDRLEVLVDRLRLPRVIEAMLKAHPYDEVAYDILNLENSLGVLGLGVSGKLERSTKLTNLIPRIKRLFGVGKLRVIGANHQSIRKVGICTGSGASLLPEVFRQKIDLYITGDVKYHQATEARQRDTCVIDVGHFYSEIHAVTILKDLFGKLFGSELKLYEYKKLRDPFRII